jgi:heme exporter protein D
MIGGLAAYFAMGGYAAFVWPAYALAAAALGGLAIYSWRRHRASAAALARLQPLTGNRE